MIYSVKGVLLHKSPFSCVVQVSGTGLSLELKIPLSTYEALPEAGSDVVLYTQLVVSGKSGEPVLYGFLRRDERFIFRKLIDMPGVGPSLAIRLLSGMSPGELISAADKGDVRAISSIKGVGPRRAERIAFELKERLSEFREVVGEEAEETEVVRGHVADSIANAVEALVALGLKRPEAEMAVSNAVSSLGKNFTIEDLIRKALSSRKP